MIANPPGVQPDCAAIYARTSPGPSQRDNYSIDEQVEAAWDLCERKNWTVRRVFVDSAMSGKDTERPKFQEMLECARRNEFSVLVVWKLDRACRSLADLVNVQRELQNLGICLASVTEALDTTTSTGRFAIRNLGSFAELERELISERTKLGLCGLARERRWPNAHPPLGYDLDREGRLVVNPNDALLVVRMFQDYVRVRSMPQVAFDLNAQGVPTKKGSGWNARAIRDIIQNEVYRGVYSVAGVTDQMEELRIVDDDLFHQAKEERLRYTIGHSGRTPMALSRREAKIETIYSRFQGFLGESMVGGH